MKTKDAIDYFGGTRQVADALGISTQAVYKWGDNVPKDSAEQLHEITGGTLVYRKEDYQKSSQNRGPQDLDALADRVARRVASN